MFGGEHSAHYYFARNYRADSGLIATVLVLDEVSRAAPGAVDRAQAVRALLAERRDQHPGRRCGRRDGVDQRRRSRRAPQDHLDGLTVDCGTWWFNLRPSNTEPLLRLNLEAETRDECDAHVAELLALITSV